MVSYRGMKSFRNLEGVASFVLGNTKVPRHSAATEKLMQANCDDIHITDSMPSPSICLLLIYHITLLQSGHFGGLKHFTVHLLKYLHSLRVLVRVPAPLIQAIQHFLSFSTFALQTIKVPYHPYMLGHENKTRGHLPSIAEKVKLRSPRYAAESNTHVRVSLLVGSTPI